MSQFVTIKGVQAGRKQTLFPDWQLPYQNIWHTLQGQITLRELLAQVVKMEVAAYQQRQTAQQTVRVLTARQIHEGAGHGKISSGGRELTPIQLTDVDVAFATALEAFTDGLYFVFVDGNQVETVDTIIHLYPDSTVTFVRLVALAGG